MREGSLGIDRAKTKAELARLSPPTTGGGGYTPRAWTAMENSATIALNMGHNYVGTEHLLMALLADVGGIAHEALVALGVTAPEIVEFVRKTIGEISTSAQP